jgi:Flp pilus assembly protein TadG
MITYGQDAVRLALRVARRAKHAIAARPRRIAANIWRDQRGVTAIEFAFVALPMFSMIFGTMSLGIYYFYESGIDLAVYASARQIMTGSAQGSSLALLDSPTDFVTNVLCSPNNMPNYIACSTSNVTAAITIVSDFNNLTQQSSQTKNTQTYTLTTLKKQGAAACRPAQGEIVYIQVTYTVPALNAIYAAFGNAQILSGTTIKVEEFPNAVLNGKPTDC